MRKHLESNENVDVTKIAAMIVESLADFILSVEPEAEQARVMADALAHFGQAFLDRGDDEQPGPHAGALRRAANQLEFLRHP